MTRPSATTGPLNPWPTALRQTTRGPPGGHVSSRGGPVYTPLRVGPSSCGQSAAVTEVSVRTSAMGTSPRMRMATVWHTAPPVLATYVHRIDPIIASIGGLHVWWYGLGFALGFWQMHRFIQRHRTSLHLDAREAFTLSLMVIAGVLIGGRTIEILFDEWPFYRDHATFIPRYWLGRHGHARPADRRGGRVRAVLRRPTGTRCCAWRMRS